ncbi:MAG: 50S ribosomal protein L35 [bacterium]|nr:50S ribosomal protein L35 [bacterium]
MPKTRTRSGVKKRFFATAGSTIKRDKAYARHILTSKSTKRKRKLRQSDSVSPSESRRVKRMLGI